MTQAPAPNDMPEEIPLRQFISVDRNGNRVFDLKAFAATPEGRERLLMLVNRSRAALATPVPVGWRPIETAPEGKDILVYCRETGECFVVFWALQMETKQGDWVIARANDGTCFICKNPTHWQPLPAPPHTEERG